MPFCQCPQNDEFSLNGKCGKKINYNSDLHLCNYHLNILYKAKPNPKKAFPPSCICLICNNHNHNIIYDNSICYNCLSDNESKNITLNGLLKCFTKNQKLIYSCDNKIIVILKKFLNNFDEYLPQNYTIDISNNKLTIFIDNLKLKEYKIDTYFNLSMTDILITYL